MGCVLRMYTIGDGWASALLPPQLDAQMQVANSEQLRSTDVISVPLHGSYNNCAVCVVHLAAWRDMGCDEQ
jgi:hypothetical protein